MKSQIQTACARLHQTGRSAPFKFLPGLILILLAGPLQAANDTWNGAAGDPMFSWTNKNNWVAVVAPVANDVLFFDGSTGLVNSNGFAAATQFDGIIFNAGAGAFQLGGNAFNLGGSITNLSANLQTITNDMTPTTSLNFDVGASGLTVWCGADNNKTGERHSDGDRRNRQLVHGCQRERRDNGACEKSFGGHRHSCVEWSDHQCRCDCKI